MYQEFVAKAKNKLNEAQLRRKRLKVKSTCDCKKSEPKMDDTPTEDRLSLELKPELERSEKISKENAEEKPRLGLPRNYSEQNLKTLSSESEPKKCCSKSNPNLLDYSDECSMELIQLDISRTFPHLCIFQPGGPYFDVLHELLAAYVCYRPDIGYIQVRCYV